MPPTSLAALALLLLATVPGYLHVRIVETRSARPPRSSAIEVIDLLCVGLASSVLAYGGVLALGHLAPGTFVDLSGWAGQGQRYLRTHPWQALLSALTGLLLASGMAGVSALVAVRGRSGRVEPGSVWHSVLTRTKDGRPPYLSVELVDGRVFDGFVGAFGAQDTVLIDDLCLNAPLFARSDDRATRVTLPGSSLLIARSQIKTIRIRYIDVPAPAPAPASGP